MAAVATKIIALSTRINLLKPTTTNQFPTFLSPSKEPASIPHIHPILLKKKALAPEQNEKSTILSTKKLNIVNIYNH